MLLFIVSPESETRAKVTSIYHDTSGLSSAILAKGITVDTMLEETPQPKKSGILYINPQTLEQWYEYVDRAPSIAESISDVSIELAVLKILVMLIVPKWSGKTIEYEKNDIVRMVNGDIYQCLTTHISAAEYKPTIYPAYWKLLLKL